MNIRDLKYLIALSRHHHFGKAAKACCISQPALSMQIKKLEADLGVALLERNNKAVLLTPLGVAITEKAQYILDQTDAIYTLAKAGQDPLSGELRIGIIPTLAPYLLPLIMPSLALEFPNVRFYLCEEHTDSLIPKLKLGSLDAAFLALPVTETHLCHKIVFAEEFLLAVPLNHPLSHRKMVQQAELSQEDVLLLEEGHCMRGQALDICHKVNANEMQNFRATSLETLRHMVASGNGITLIPKLAQQANDSLAYIPFSPPKPSRTIGLYWRLSSTKKVLLKELALRVKKTIDPYVSH